MMNLYLWVEFPTNEFTVDLVLGGFGEWFEGYALNHFHVTKDGNMEYYMDIQRMFIGDLLWQAATAKEEEEKLRYVWARRDSE